MTLCTVPARAQQVAGVIERQAGDVTRAGGNGAVQTLARGAVIYVGDRIETGEAGRVLVRFTDSSRLTLSANATVVIDEFVYSAEDGAAASNRQALNFLTGVYKFISGASGASNPGGFTGNTPVATIGIRGTEFVGGELTVGMPPGTSHIGFQIRAGAIAVTNTFGSVTLDAPGEGTFIPLDGSAAPTPVRQWTAEEAAEADALLAF
ncbi:FecR domain-containing protein [Marivibrio halodurans]|uniref:FecR domain-containing protein n=1 Tax=Marivibrio halodurans TaxID=2039722 RepID=A0A8J7S3P5_9PROT|nr:FecR family protein [Marivibrio halodurans]MBP5856134.1 FecR domain-containing protein [Marivibrio halodurans]